MALNEVYAPQFHSQMADHSILNAEIEEAQMVQAQQNAATLLYLKNRDQIWSTNSRARQGSDYSERLERINQDDQRNLPEMPLDDDDSMLSHPLSDTSLGLYSLLMGKLQAPSHLSTSTFQWLQNCDSDIREASVVLARIQKPGYCVNPIELLEKLFDKMDDVNILLESLEVDEALKLYKTEVRGNAEALCTDIERAAKSFCV